MAKIAYTAMRSRPGPVFLVLPGRWPACSDVSVTFGASSTSVPDLIHAGSHDESGNSDGGQDKVAPPGPLQDGPVHGGHGQQEGGGEITPELPRLTRDPLPRDDPHYRPH